MARNRLYVLLPCQSGAQLSAARAVLSVMRNTFRLGGTWFALESDEPVVHGWWTNPGNADSPTLRLPVRDDHILVMFDHESNSATKSLDEAIALVAACFRWNYRAIELEETTIAINSHPIGVHHQLGRYVDVAAADTSPLPVPT